MRVYFLQRGPAGPIKIGFSRHPKRRIAEIQRLCAEPVEVLLLLRVDSRRKEREIHEKFRHLRLKGEWFASAPDLLSWVLEQKAVGGSEDLTEEAKKPVECRVSVSSERLRALVRPPPPPYTVSGIAKALGVSRPTVRAWCEGVSKPSIEQATKLEALVPGVSTFGWSEPLP